MTRRDLIILFILGLVTPLIISQFQSLPGYMDADYYYGGGIQLVKGNGFTEPYIWNYLNDPQSLPTPSHTYWMPLASLLSAAGMYISGKTTYTAARIGFILLAALIPPLTGILANRFTTERTLSWLSGLLACFPIYYAPFLPVTDNYAIYMVLGVLYFLLLSSLLKSKHPLLVFFAIGLVSALMNLARSDGLLWLGISLLVAIWYGGKLLKSNTVLEWKIFFRLTHRKTYRFILCFSCLLFFILAGFILLMLPWYARNLSSFGSLVPPGGSRAIWLTSYNDTFIYPASQLTMDSWLTSGWGAILQARAKALNINLLNAFAAQAGIILFPFILTGLWSFRKDFRIRFAVLTWIILLVTMTLVFPFAGARGAFFHAGAALQPVWWAVTPVGLDAIITTLRRRGWFDDRAFIIFRSFLLIIVILMTLTIFLIRVLPGWEREDGHYEMVDQKLIQFGASEDAIVIVRNPPGYYIVTSRASLALPANGIAAVLQVAAHFHAQYLILEPDGISEELRVLYENPSQSPAFIYLGENDGIRLFEIIQ